MKDMNEQQELAIKTLNGPVLIIAGAGSGKTRVITHRIINLIKNGVAPRSILAITFTNKAATEMRERVFDLIAKDSSLNRPISSQDRPFVSTFHSLGVRIIRDNASLVGLTRHFTIFDRADSRRAVKEAMVQVSVDPKQFDPNMILNLISRAKGDGVSRLVYSDHAKDYIQEIVAQVWEKYEAIMAKEKALDFDDLLYKTAFLLSKPEIRQHYSHIWKYVHIDEYQDTNRIQYQIAKYLCEENRNICVVGDVDQNIYSWRGATIENIMNFEKDYPEAKVITLEKNYRSTKTILSAANQIIEKNQNRRKKNLFTDNEDGDKISLVISYSELEEARSIAETTRQLIESGVPEKEIAVLYRTNFQSRVLEEAFIKKNIPYQLIGVRFFERKEVKDVLSYIKASLNRESFGDIARIINVPARGIGKVSVAKLLAGEEKSLPPAMREKVSNFWKLLDDIKKEIEEKKPSDVLRFIIQESGLEKSLRDGDPENEERLLNIRELVSVAAQYDTYESENSEDKITGIEAFLANAALASDQDEIKEDKNAVRLMTVHASKGLEFQTVFISGLEQDLFPFKHLNDEQISEADEEEERRLFYVALTRAKKKLYLSYAFVRSIYGSQRVNTPSEFIEDIEEKLIDNMVPEKPTGAKAIFIDF